MMKDPARLQTKLDLAQVAVEKGIVHIEKQKALIAHRIDHGEDLAPFHHFLAILEESQRLHVEHRDRLRKEIDQAIDEEIRRLAELARPQR